MFTIENIKQAIVNQAEVGKEYRQTEIGKLFEAEFNVKLEDLVGDDSVWGILYHPFKNLVQSDTCQIEGLHDKLVDGGMRMGKPITAWRWVYNPSTPVARVVKKVTRKPEEKDDVPVAPVKAMKLYAFCYPNQVRRALALGEPFEVKIGQTVNEAQDRIDGQTSGSGVSEDPITLWTTTLNGEVKTDHQFHRFLVSINSGVSRVKRDKKKTTEWFEFECRDHLTKSAAKLTLGEIESKQFIEELSGYVTKVLNKALEHQERQLAPVKAPELSVVYQEVIKVMLPWVAELNGLKKWYEDEVMVQDMKYISDEKWNQPYVMTHELAVMMMSKVVAAPSMHNTFLVIEAVELVDCLVKLGYDPSCIHFMSTSSAKRDTVELKYGIGVRNGKLAIETYRQKNKKGDFRFMSKFDYCLMNPPYEQGLGADFLNMAIDMAHQVVSVQPTTPVINMRPTNRAGRDNDMCEALDKYKSSMYMFDGNPMFGAGFLTPLGVFHIDTRAKNIDGVEVTGYYNAKLPTAKINQIGEWVLPFYEKFADVDSVLNHVSDGSFYVNIGEVRGHSPELGQRFNNDFFTMVPADLTVSEEKRAPNEWWRNFGFNTKEEAENFLGYIKLKLPRFLLSLYKVNIQISRTKEMALIPWMDFTQEWTDEKLCKHFGITKAEWTKIDEFIPDYY